MEGFLNLNKPKGMTSHDCVGRIRRLLRIKRVGHGGTLDPAATGVLPIAIGKATRLLQYMRSDKAYWATVRFGVTTTTDDLEGEIVTSEPAFSLKRDQVEETLPQFLGKIQQVPPAYSAIQVNGTRLYELARAGEAVEVPARQVEVRDIEVLGWRAGDFPEIDLAIACGPGTYIRAIARDIGAQVQTGATLARLTRTASSGFHLEDSVTFADVETQLQKGDFQLIPPATALAHLNAITLNREEARRWCQGQQLRLGDRSTLTPPLQVYREDGRFLGIGQINPGETPSVLRPKMVFHPLS